VSPSQATNASCTSQDIDLIIDAVPTQLQTFIKLLPADEYYADLAAALAAQKEQSLFNVIDLKTGWKIDLIFRKSRRFSEEEFSRRKGVVLQGIPVSAATAEDLVVAKLEWAKLAQSEKQIEDVAGILAMSRNSLDRMYLEKWITELGLGVQWERAQAMAKTLGSA